jgi:xylan 1,4-beta-xylosidase
MKIKKYLILLFLLCAVSAGYTQVSTLKIVAPSKQEQLNMPWRNIIAVGRANNLLRADILEHLAYAQKVMGYRFCRFHAIFDDEMDVVKRDEKTGKLIFQWHQVDQVYDALLKLGIKPFVELNPMPKVMASGTQDMFNYKMNVTPPKSYDEWEYLVYSFTQHMVERYGIDEVRSWYFEVWNEPNLSGFWGGTQEEYFKLYTASAKAVKRVDPKLRIGGPASSKGNWIKEIINYTTKNKVPLDFVSTHLYPQDEQVQYPDRKGSPHKIGDFFSYTVKEVEQWVRESARPDLEIHWTEWNTQTAASAKQITWGDNIYVDNLYAASFIVRNCLELDKSAKSFAYWVVSDIFDEGGIPHAPFSNTYGLISIHGIPKASFNAFRFLRKMTGTIQTVVNKKSYPDGTGVLVTKEQGLTKVLLWNQNFVEKPVLNNWDGTIDVPLEKDTIYNSIRMTIGLAQGSVWESWQVMGTPLNLTNTQYEFLKAKSEPGFSQKLLTSKNKQATINFTLKPGEVQYIEINPQTQSAIKRVLDPAELKRWEEAQSGLSNN